ncbi:MAG: hypothetical protein EXR51_08760 [Dehalococcoidia bacterium]|nr:hypothetical protein [Dehalococcoidia bacterium]
MITSQQEQHAPLARWSRLLAGAAGALMLAATACSGAPTGWAAATAAGGKVFVVTQGQKLLALDPQARSKGTAFPAPGEWQYPAETDRRLGASYTPPTLAGDVLYAVTYTEGTANQGKLRALNAASGLLLWEFAAAEIVSQPAVKDGLVYLGSSDSHAYALDAGTGQVRWKFKTGHKIWANVALDDSRSAYVASLDHKLYALNAADGTQQWTFPTGGALASAPAIDRSTLFFGSADGRLYAVNARSGEKQWELNLGAWLWATPLLNKGILYAGSLDGQVVAVDASSGKQVWDQPYRTDGPVSAAALMVGDILVVAAQSGKVYGLDPATGRLRWNYVADPSGQIFSSPAADAQSIYLAPGNQRLIALDGARGQPTWVHRTEG